MSYTLVNPGLHEKQLHRIPDGMGDFAGVVLRAQATMLFSRQGLSDSTTVLAEELAQDALVAALEQWPKSGVPDNPGAWLMASAKHRGIDQLRRGSLVARKHEALAHEL